MLEADGILSLDPVRVFPEEFKVAAIISWDALIEQGYEPEIIVPVETQVLRKIEMEEVRARIEAKDPKIWKAFAMKLIIGESAKTVARELGVSAPRVYQLVEEAKDFFRQYEAED